MKNIALIALLGVTQASESTTNTKAVAANTNAQMAQAVASSDLDLKEFATKDDEEEEDNSKDKTDEDQLNKNHGRDKNGMFKNHKNFVMMRNKINDQESKHQSMFDTINKKLADDNFISQAISMTAYQTGQDLTSTASPDGMSEADTICYNSNYSDIGGAENSRQHYTTVGHEQGRQPNCGRSLTPIEEQIYLNRYPDLQHSFGTGGSGSRRLAHEHFINFGFKEKRNANPWPGYNEEAQFCIDGDMTNQQDSCKCDGTIWFGRREDEEGKRIDTWEKFRMWPSMPKTNEAVYLRCNKYTFGVPPGTEGKTMACWCEPKPQYLPRVCAEKTGDDCMCNGRVIYGQHEIKGINTIKDTVGANGIQATKNYWTVQNFNNTGHQTCGPALFETIDPLVGKDKRCYCDEDNKSISAALELQVKKYWRGVLKERELKAEKIRAAALALAAQKKAEEERIAEAERLKKATEAREQQEKMELLESEATAKEQKIASDAKILAAANAKIAALEKAKKSAQEAAVAEKEKAAQELVQENLKIEMEKEQDQAKKAALIIQMEAAKKKAIQAAVDAEIAKARAEAEKADAESEEEATKAKAEADAREKVALDAQRKKAKKAAEEAEAAHTRELESRAHAAAEARSALAEKYKAELEKQMSEALEQQKTAFEEQQKEQAASRKEEQEKKNRAQAILLAEKKKQEELAADELAKQQAEEKKAEQEKIDAEKAANKKKLDAEKEKLKLKKKEFEKKQAIAKAKQDLIKAQLEEEKAQSTEEVKAAQEKAAAATKAAEEAEKERQKTLAEQKALDEEIDNAQLRVAEANRAAQAAKNATAAAKESAAAWKKRAQDAKEKAAKEMAEDEEEAKEREAELKAEVALQAKKAQEALAAQAAAYAKAAAQAKAAAKAAEASRKAKEKAQLDQQKKLMEERRSDFASTYAHTWDLGSPKVQMFEFTAQEIGFAHATIQKLFFAYAIADVQIIKTPITRTYLENDVVNFAGGDFKIVGVTTDDKRQDVIKIINEAQNSAQYPASDTRFWALATGSKDYINWVKEQVKDKGTDEDDIGQFLTEGTTTSNDASPNTGVDGKGDNTDSGSKGKGSKDVPDAKTVQTGSHINQGKDEEESEEEEEE